MKNLHKRSIFSVPLLHSFDQTSWRIPTKVAEFLTCPPELLYLSKSLSKPSSIRFSNEYVKPHKDSFPKPKGNQLLTHTKKHKNTKLKLEKTKTQNENWKKQKHKTKTEKNKNTMNEMATDALRLPEGVTAYIFLKGRSRLFCFYLSLPK